MKHHHQHTGFIWQGVWPRSHTRERACCDKGRNELIDELASGKVTATERNGALGGNGSKNKASMVSDKGKGNMNKEGLLNDKIREVG